MNWLFDMFSDKDAEIKKKAELINQDTEWERKLTANDWVKDVMALDESAIQQEADATQRLQEQADGVDDIMRWEEGDMAENDEVAMFQKMINDGSVWHMPGSTGRRAMELLRAGLCELGEQRFKDAYGNTVPSKHDVQPGTVGAPLETRNKEAAVADHFIYKTAAYVSGDDAKDTVEKDYELEVKGLSDYNLAEMLSEYAAIEKGVATLSHNEYKEDAMKEVSSGREAAEKKLLKFLGDHTLIDWKKAFKDMEDSEVKHAAEKDLYSEWKEGKMAWEGKKTSFEAPSDKEKLEQMDGVGKEEEKGQVGKKAALKCPNCGSSESVTPAHDNKLNKCDACHTAFDNESAKEATVVAADAPVDTTPETPLSQELGLADTHEPEHEMENMPTDDAPVPATEIKEEPKGEEALDPSKAALDAAKATLEAVEALVKDRPELVSLIEEAENKVFEIEKQLTGKVDVSEEEKMEPEHKEVLETPKDEKDEKDEKDDKKDDEEIESQASKKDVIQKVAEIASPWRVIKNENGEELIARVAPSKNDKKSKENEHLNGINSQDVK